MKLVLTKYSILSVAEIVMLMNQSAHFMIFTFLAVLFLFKSKFSTTSCSLMQKKALFDNDSQSWLRLTSELMVRAGRVGPHAPNGLTISTLYTLKFAHHDPGTSTAPAHFSLKVGKLLRVARVCYI